MALGIITCISLCFISCWQSRRHRKGCQLFLYHTFLVWTCLCQWQKEMSHGCCCKARNESRFSYCELPRVIRHSSSCEVSCAAATAAENKGLHLRFLIEAGLSRRTSAQSAAAAAAVTILKSQYLSLCWLYLFAFLCLLSLFFVVAHVVLHLDISRSQRP